MDILLITATLGILVLWGYALYLKRQIRLAHKEFAEFKSHVVMVPVPKKKQSPWLPVLAISTLLLALALTLLALILMAQS
jgi:hypothetical protein